MKYFLTITIVFTSLLIRGQAAPKLFQVVGDLDKEPLEYVHIKISKEDTLLYVGQTGADGVFYLLTENFPEQSIIELSHIAHKPKALSLLEISSLQLVTLNFDTEYLEEVKVYSTNSNRPQKVRVTGAKDKKEDLSRTQSTGSELSTFINLTKRDKLGVITKVRIKMSRSTQEQYPFRIHFYEAQGSYELPPLERIITLKEIYYSGMSEEWIEFDVSDYNIPLTEKGLFVSIECLPSETPKIYEVIDYNGCVKKASHMSIAAYQVGKHFLLWKRSQVNPEWKRASMHFMLNGKKQYRYRAQPMIQVEYVKINE